MEYPSFWKWFGDSNGQIAIIYSLVAIPILLMAGIAIDTARSVNAERHLEFASETASLAAARAMEDASLSDAEIREIANFAFFAQLNSAHADVVCATPDVALNRSEKSAAVIGNCEVPTLFGAEISGHETISVSGASSAIVKLTTLEVVLVIDVSGSMNGAKIANAKTAAHSLLSMLLGDRTEDRVRIGIVPFSTGVNAGIYGNRAMGRFDLDDRFGDGTDMVCVRERTGPQRYTDAPPMPGQWINELLTTSAYTRCEEPEIRPLSNDFDDLNLAIEGLRAGSGGTAGDLALAWSWYMLSPEWDGVWPSASKPSDYGDEDTIKAIVFLTDGNFNRWYERSAWSGFHAINDAYHLCSGMQDTDDIAVFTIGYDLPRGTGAFWDAEAVLRHCASDEHSFFVTDTGEELREIYDEIGTRLIGTSLVGEQPEEGA